jgi:DNA (cytosine-5)-methyltransferase 1
MAGKPRLLDLFCGAGGAAMGYSRAGFEVVGVDIEPQPNYPFEFIQCDVMEFPLHAAIFTRDIDAIHASPPCQSYSRAMRHLAFPQPMLLDETRELLESTGLPYVIENVIGSPLPHSDDLFGRFGTTLCGTMFGMRIYRHRLFETSFPVVADSCNHSQPAMNPHNVKGRELIYAEFGKQNPDPIWEREMGIDWMDRYEAREAIPPAYTEFIGQQLLENLGVNHGR